MTEKITNGDYVKDGNGLAEIRYIEELLQDVSLSLQALRGSFYPDKNYGSQLRSSADKCEARAVCYARQALSGFDGIYVKSAKITDNGYVFTVMVNDQERQVSIKA